MMGSAREVVKRVKGRLVVPLAALAVTVALGACASVESYTPPAGASNGDLAIEQSIFVVKYGNDSVEYDADRGTLLVPENRSVPGSRLIALPVIRVHALTENPEEPIFHLSGGPGTSNMTFSHLEGLIDNHDIVLVGYRGVDGSVSLELPEVSQAFKGVGNDLLSEESMQKLADSFRQGAERLRDEGVDTDGYTMVEVVKDIEAARVALGYERINLLSQSYGTRLAQFYAYMYPDALFRSAMISVNPPGHFVWDPDVVDQLIEYDATLLARDPEWRQRTPDLVATIRNVAHDMPESWYFLPINPGKVKMMTQFMLFHRDTAAAAYDSYIGAEEGDYSGLAMMSLMYDLMMPNANNWGEWAAKGAADYRPGRDYLAEMLPEDSIIGAPLSALGSSATTGWPSADLPAELTRVQPSDVETLLINGNIDYSTPVQYARDELLPALSNGRQVVLSEYGHTGDVWRFQPNATVHLLTTFFDTGEADDSLFTYQPMDFNAGPNFRSMAKVGLGLAASGVVGITGLAALTIWLLVR